MSLSVCMTSDSFNSLRTGRHFQTHANLFIASKDGKFQSRNRDAFLFNQQQTFPWYATLPSFNLAIEMLFFSTHAPEHAYRTGLSVSISQSRCFFFQLSVVSQMARSARCFNLAIEMLFFSTTGMGTRDQNWGRTFQSRNRETFLFNYRRALW